MSDNAQQPKSFPAVLEGTVFRPKTGTSASGAPFIAFTLGVYAGKDKQGAYRKGPYVDVTVVGDAVKFGEPAERTRVRVAGYLEERDFQRRDGTPDKGLSLCAFGIKKIEVRAQQPAGAAPANSAAPANAAAPQKPASVADMPPVGLDDDYFDDQPVV